MKSLLWFLFIVLFGAASVIKPDFPSHQQKIYETATGHPSPPAEELAALPEWKKLNFRDFYLVTATQSEARKSIVSYGFFRHVTVVDKEWWEQPDGKKMAEPQ